MSNFNKTSLFTLFIFYNALSFGMHSPKEMKYQDIKVLNEARLVHQFGEDLTKRLLEKSTTIDDFPLLQEYINQQGITPKANKYHSFLFMSDTGTIQELLKCKTKNGKLHLTLP